jgi:hypothetical protein
MSELGQPADSKQSQQLNVAGKQLIGDDFFIVGSQHVAQLPPSAVVESGKIAFGSKGRFGSTWHASQVHLSPTTKAFFIAIPFVLSIIYGDEKSRSSCSAFTFTDFVELLRRWVWALTFGCLLACVSARAWATVYSLRMVGPWCQLGNMVQICNVSRKLG